MAYNLPNRWGGVVDTVSTILMSVLLALIIWIVAIDQENPLERHQVGPIPITVRGLTGGYQTSQDLSEKTVLIEVRAPRRTWDVLSESDFTAYIDLSDLEAGSHDVPIQVEKDNPEAEILSIQPRLLRVHIEPLVTKEVPVRPEIEDSPATGYDIQQPIVEPNQVTVRGPASVVDQVMEAVAEIYVRGAKTQVERIQGVVPRDAQNRPVDRVEVEPATVQILVPIAPRPGRKEVAVLVQLEGQPAPGYRISNVKVEPPTVVLLGDPEALSNVPGYVETTRLSIENATGEVQERLPLLVPEDVSVLNDSDVSVTVTISPIEGSITVTSAPIVRQTDSNTNVTVSLKQVNVILSGSLPKLQALQPEDVRVELDVGGLPPGSHVIQPKVIVPDGVHVEGVLPEAIEVLIESSATATPTAEPTPAAVSTPATPSATVPPAKTPTPEGSSSGDQGNQTIPKPTQPANP